jgi:hypothetical protein
MIVIYERGNEGSPENQTWVLKPRGQTPATLLCVIAGAWTIWNGLTLVSLEMPLWTIFLGYSGIDEGWFLLFNAIDILFGALCLLASSGVWLGKRWGTHIVVASNCVIIAANLFRLSIGLPGMALCILAALAARYSAPN